MKFEILDQIFSCFRKKDSAEISTVDGKRPLLSAKTQHLFWADPAATTANCNDFLFMCRKQEELVYSVRKRLEEALMADMLAHVEEAAHEGEPLKEEGNGSEDMESV